MKINKRHLFAAVAVFVAGITVGYAAKKVEPSAFREKTKKEAGLALLKEARAQAEDGSWERIAVGRIYYLAGMKQEGQAIFDEVLSKGAEQSDYFRVARVYREAKEWSKAKALFDAYVTKNPKDEKGIAEIGAYYMLNGDRATAEQLYERSFARKAEVWATTSAAAGYLGVEPQE